MTINNIKIALFLAFTCFTLQSEAQLATAPEPTLESPYNTVYVHLFFLQSDTYEPEIAAQTIAPVLDSAAAVEIAIQIKQIYDGKGLYVRLNNLPQEEAFLDSITEKPFTRHFQTTYLRYTLSALMESGITLAKQFRWFRSYIMIYTHWVQIFLFAFFRARQTPSF